MPRYLSKFGLDGVLKLLKVMRADVLAQSPEYRYRLDQIADAEEIAKNLAAQKPCLSLSELQINGRTLMDIGIPQGRKLGAVLAQLLDEVIDGVTKYAGSPDDPREGNIQRDEIKSAVLIFDAADFCFVWSGRMCIVWQNIIHPQILHNFIDI